MNPQFDQHPAQILLIDDSKINRLLATHSMAKSGHAVTEAENGQVGWELLRSNEKRFDVIILDIEMPVLNGFEVLARIEEDAALCEIPVIVTSSVEGADSVVRCIEMGAADYLIRPVNPTILRAKVNAVLAKKRQHDMHRNWMSRFAAPEVLAAMESSGFQLGGKHVEASVLFCDLRDFTTLAEKLSAEDAIDLLNTYYALMFDCVKAFHGVVNAIMGDGLMVVFGAPAPMPNHAELAVRAGQAMIAIMRDYNVERAMQQSEPLLLSVGIATGQMAAGYTGTMDRASYSCVGDTVNLASRLESLTRQCGEDLLISAATRAALGDAFSVRDLGLMPIKGKAQSVAVYAI